MTAPKMKPARQPAPSELESVIHDAKPKHPGGRPTKLTTELREQIAQSFALGLTARSVCELHLIGETTFFRWIARGKADELAGRKKSEYWKFWETLKAARVAFEVKHIVKLDQASDWRAHAWMLERVRPNDYGPKDRKSDEVDKPREGVIVDTEVHPIAAILDEAKRQGGNWLGLALERLSGKSLGVPQPALPPAEVKVAPPPTQGTPDDPA